MIHFFWDNGITEVDFPFTIPKGLLLEKQIMSIFKLRVY